MELFTRNGYAVPYLALAPTIVTGAITLGFVQQIIRAFGRVETSLQYLVRSWPIIVELISVWKRLREFENKLKKMFQLKQLNNDIRKKNLRICYLIFHLEQLYLLIIILVKR